MSFRWVPLSRRAGRARHATSTAQARSAQVRRKAVLEFLEDRTLLSSTIPLNSATWTSIGPAGITNTATFGNTNGTGGPISGRITGIAADPTTAATVYVATAGGGVWKTTDNGNTWATTTDGQPTLIMGSIAVSKSNPQVIYAGTGEANFSFRGFAGHGVLKSTDGGTTWTLVGQAQFDRKSISKIVIDPTNANTVYAAVSARAINATPGNTGVYKSTDGGATWTNTTATTLSTTDVYSALVINPTNPLVLYAAIGTPNGTAANGVYKTVNGGTTWAPAGNFTPTAADGRIALAISQSNPNELLASVSIPTGGGGQSLKELDISLDAGVTWNPLPKTPNYLGTGGNISNAVAIDPLNPNTLYGAGDADYSTNPSGADWVVESTNGGATWFDISVDANGTAPHTGVHALAFNANGRMLVGTDGGIWRLQNPAPATFRWNDMNGNLADVNFNSVALDPTTPNVAYGAAQGQGVSKFNDGPVWSMIQGNTGGRVAVDPVNSQNVYFEDYGLNFSRSINGGTSSSPATVGISGSDPIARIAPFVIDPSNPNHLLFGTNRIYTSNNKAAFWTPLTTVNTAGFNDTNPIQTIAIAPNNPSTIYAATTTPKVFVSVDAGATWTERDIPGVTDSINQIIVDPQNAQTAYAVRASYNGPTGTGHVFQTTNGGVTWKDISGNLPDLPTWSIALDNRTGRIYAGTDAGVYASTDGGVTWAVFKAGLPNAQVQSLEFNPTLNILLAGTNGRGAFEIFGTESLGVILDTTQGQEGTALNPNKPVAEFNDSTGLQAPSAYTATVTFGDGTTVPASRIAPLPDGNYGIFAPHTYAEEGRYTLSVSVSNPTSGVSGQLSNTVTVGDAPITAQPNPAPINAVEGVSYSGPVGSFVDANPNAPLSDFTVSIDWGDGKTSGGTVAPSPSPAAAGTFVVSGVHTYGANQVNATPTITATVTDKGSAFGSTAPAVITNNFVSVTDAPLTPFPNTPAPQRTIGAVAGAATPTSTTVASFTDADPTAKANYYDVTIDWGDGTTPDTFFPGSGVVVSRGTRFDVVAGHTFAKFGTYDVKTTVTDLGPNFSNSPGSTTTLDTTANVTDAPITTITANPVFGTEGQSFTGQVAVFTSSNLQAATTDFKPPVITWGDLTTTQGTIASLGNGRFSVSTSRAFPEEGQTSFQVSVQTLGSTTPVTANSAATIADAPVTVTTQPVAGIAGSAVGGTVATFVDGNPQAPLSDFSATINWGDGSTTRGTVAQPNGPGTAYAVTGSHVFAVSGVNPVTVTVRDVGGASDAGTTTATVTEGVFTVTGVTIPTLTEGGSFSGTVALLNSGNPLAVPSEYIATIDYGDNSAPAQGTLVNQGNGVFTVSSPGGHTYAEEGNYTIGVSVRSVSSGTLLTGSSGVTVTDAPITTAQSGPLSGFAGTPVSGVVASFTEYANAPLSDFNATIDWGDGQTSQGSVSVGPQGTFVVIGTHLYTVAGSYATNVTVKDVGGSTGVVSGTANVGDPQITSTSNAITAIKGQRFAGVLATFNEPNTFATAGEFVATVNWGDNTPATLGVVTGGNGTFAVSGAHTFSTASVATPVTVTIVHTLGGSTAASTGFAHVLALLAGAVSPSSDTGPSNHDGITRNTAPVFTGVADPGAAITLFAAPAGNLSARTQVGSTTADRVTGRWSVQISPLSDGVYAVTASMTDPLTSVVAATVPLSTGARTGALVIATHGPTVSSVTVDPRTGTLHVIFQTGPAGLYAGGMVNTANYVFSTINKAGTLTALTPTRLTTANLGAGKLETNVTYRNGTALANGGYVVDLRTANLIDLAGNPVVETTHVTFPQTTNSPNPDYVAQFNVSAGRASGPVQYISLAEQQAASAYVRGTGGRLVIRVPRRVPTTVIRLR